MNRNFLLVGAGGFVGSISRYLVAVSLDRTLHPFPTGTFLINIAGCLLIGIIYGISDRNALLTPEWRLFLATGFCGGFTTFSAFAYENIHLIATEEYLHLFLYTGASIVIGFLAAAAGVFIAKQF
ncbi:MAG TPA: fluoride efflux transporter CrcB [Candidatus Kapabacteria bacterium]|nr:fluoride efflux transporter CrcB [Candidatus Kapabacteria bacterium]